jgi:Rod binding domain-containing protein
MVHEPGSAYERPARIAQPKRSRDDVDPQIRKAAEGLESMFMNQMMQAMRNTVQESEFSLENPATKIYRGMLDSEISQQAARTNSIGLADQIIAYLEQRGYTGNKAPRTGSVAPLAGSAAKSPAVTEHAKKRTGGTDAS